jgi:hypothetical protein
MRRTWVLLLLGATLLWLCACARGQEESTEPAPGDGGGTGVTDPGVTAEPEVVGSEVDGDYAVTIEEPADGQGELPLLIAEYGVPNLPADRVLAAMAESGDGTTNPDVAGAGDLRPLLAAMEPEAGDPAAGCAQAMLTLSVQTEGDQSMAGILTSFAGRVGMPQWPSLPAGANLNLNPEPQVSQVESTIGLGITGQTATFSSAMEGLANLTAQFGSSLPPGTGSLPEGLREFGVPQIPGLLGNQ